MQSGIVGAMDGYGLRATVGENDTVGATVGAGVGERSQFGEHWGTS